MVGILSDKDNEPDDQHTAEGQYCEARSFLAALQRIRRGKAGDHLRAVRVGLVVVSTHRRNLPLVVATAAVDDSLGNFLTELRRKHSVAVTKPEICITRHGQPVSGVP